MKIVIDTNVILDILQRREPFVHSSVKILRLVEARQIKGYITANSVTDIYYVLRRSVKDKNEVYNSIGTLLQLVDIIAVTARDITEALCPGVKDFEDELISVCAQRIKADFIITRNPKDFSEQCVPALTPDEFLKKYFEDSI